MRKKQYYISYNKACREKDKNLKVFKSKVPIKTWQQKRSRDHVQKCKDNLAPKLKYPIVKNAMASS